MKKLLLAVLVSLGLQTQAQITCDSVTTTYLNIGPDTIEVKTNLFDLGLNTFIMHAFDYYDNSGVSFYDTARHAFIPVPDPLISDTFSICNWSDFVQAPWSCFTCDTFVWNNGSWIMMSMMQEQPYFCCDSITYWIDQSQGFNIGLDTSNIVHNPDSIEVLWSICNSSQCYTGTGMYAYFGQIMTTDTIKACYDAYVYEGNSVEVCTHCDSLIYNGFNWVLFSMSNTTSINELTFNRVNDNKIYDMLGKELLEIPTGQMYIQNGKLYTTNY